MAAPDQNKAEDPQDKEPQEQRVETKHTLIIDGATIAYTAIAGTALLKDDEGKAKASIFYVAYIREDVADPALRPITFSFNGGPGSSSVWMHLGMLGPRIVSMNQDGTVPPPPYRLEENPFSLLDVTDLVFIDPVSTGYSRPTPGQEAKQFHGYDRDIESVGAFIRLITSRLQRWSSPKFLIGESYGTTRAAGLAGYLQTRHGLFLNGIMLISSILNFQTARFVVGNDLPYILFLPTYSATAWYHKKLPPDLQERPLRDLLDEVETFALDDYTLALMQGAALSQTEQMAIAERVARYIGLTAAYVARANLRVQIFRFTKELLRDQRRTVGRLDSRFVGVDRDAAGEIFEHDPSSSAIHGLYAATINDYIRRSLRFDSDLPYEILANLFRTWDYSSNQYLNVAETLRQTMSQNPYLHIHVANGYYDLATPYFATAYTFNHLELDPALQQNISMSYYEAGHMMYVHPPALAQAKEALSEFIRMAMDPRATDPISSLPQP